MAMKGQLPLVTLFSKMPGIDPVFRTLHPDIPVKFVEARLRKDEPHGLFQKLSEDEMQVLQGAEILLTDTPTVVTLLYQLPNLKWLQSTWAGVDGIFNQLDRSKPLPTYTLTKGGGICGIYLREYVIGQIIANERNFTQIGECQKIAKWSDLLKSCNSHYRTLPVLSIGILGVGEIGSEIAKACKALGMTVWGLVRQDIPVEKRYECIDHYRKMDQLPELLENCDYICNVLPSTKETIGLLNGDVLQPCQAKKSVFINVGRGNIITEESIVHALSKEWLSAAILDVFQTEPLPDDSLLCKHPQVILTPHYAAHPSVNEVIEVFVENYWRHVNGDDLKHIVSWERGY